MTARVRIVMRRSRPVQGSPSRYGGHSAERDAAPLDEGNSGAASVFEERKAEGRAASRRRGRCGKSAPAMRRAVPVARPQVPYHGGQSSRRITSGAYRGLAAPLQASCSRVFDDGVQNEASSPAKPATAMRARRRRRGGQLRLAPSSTHGGRARHCAAPPAAPPRHYVHHPTQRDGRFGGIPPTTDASRPTGEDPRCEPPSQGGEDILRHAAAPARGSVAQGGGERPLNRTLPAGRKRSRGRRGSSPHSMGGSSRPPCRGSRPPTKLR